MSADWPARIADLPPLRQVIAQHQLSAEKKFGQNFLLDLNITDKIARLAGDLTQGMVIEIGPGPGGLTRALLANGAKKVVALELDPRCVTALQPLAQVAPLTVIEADALTTDLTALGDLMQDAPRKIVANLPYNIATQLLINWLHQIGAYQSLTLMFQHEVAERIVAQAGSKHYGRLAVLAQCAATAKIVLKLPPSAFTPPPKVHSAVVQVVPRAVPLAPLEVVAKITAAAFGQRRKMLRSTLVPLVGAAALSAVGINPTQRAEEVTVTQFAELANFAKDNL